MVQPVRKTSDKTRSEIEKRLDRPPILAAITLVTSGISALMAFLLSAKDIVTTQGKPEPSLLAFLLGIFSVMGAGAAAQVVKLSQREPRIRTISLLGFPGTGKTVYLSVLYNEMMTRTMPGIQFRPYGVETTERVHEAMLRLSQNQWLPRSNVNEVFFHRARASVKGGFFTHAYRIEIPDFAGEHIAEFDSSSHQWLHRTEYFRYVLDSDAIFLCIDCETLESPNDLQRQQSALLAAIQVLMDAKDIDPPMRVKIPIALLFLKGDIVPHIQVEQLEMKVENLTSFLRTNCVQFHSFKVSSVGQTLDGLPPPRLHPENVVEPLLWAIKT